MTEPTPQGGGEDGTELAGPARVVFCGDREVGAKIVELIHSQGGEIVALGLNAPPRRYTREVRLAAGTGPGMVFYGRSFTSENALRKLIAAQPDLGVSCGFAPILPPKVLAAPRWGWVNLHRSYLPYNRGLDPLQWAMVDRTPMGVSIHVMTEQVDAGDIIAQVEMPVFPTDDGDALEGRADKMLFDLFASCWGRLRHGDLAGTPQDEDIATYHTWPECESLRHLDLNATVKVSRLLDILRAYSGQSSAGVEFELPLTRARYVVQTRVGVLSSAAPPPGGRAAGGEGPAKATGAGRLHEPAGPSTPPVGDTD